MIKEMIKKHLAAVQAERYEKELKEKQMTYESWYSRHTAVLEERLAAKNHEAGAAMTAEVVPYSCLRSYILSGEEKPDVIIACSDHGELTPCAERMIRDFFAENRDIDMLYGDEDRRDETGHLCDPWMKSDWAPDTFLSTFYFGNIFAIRSSALYLINPGENSEEEIETRSELEGDHREEIEAREKGPDEELRAWIYGQICLKIAQASGGFNKRRNGRFPVGHIGEILFHAFRKPELWNAGLISDSLTGRYSAESARERLVSIIIPSKDNFDVLKRCIDTIEEYTSASPYELIIVDNGSKETCRRRIQEMTDAFNENGRAVYLYQEMPFNFAKMCNMGAREANGEMLLFLNDDIEIRKPGWLSYLSEKAKLPYVGAVGMKLLYPGTDTIQHAGVVNVRVGPIHKLQYCDNREQLYFGFNKGVRNVLAVTGACLMMREELFRRLGGFDEEKFAVAFNDIDLCYRAYEQGYYNVVRNNMYLYHHESLSRGDDRKDAGKAARLAAEQKALLTAHRDLFGVDPFYHPYMTQNPAVTVFEVGTEDSLLEAPVLQIPRKRDAVPAEWEDPVLRLGVEYANSISDWFCGPFAEKETKGYYIKGYAFVIDGDNALYERKLLLRRADRPEEIRELSVENVFRQDIADNLTDQIHDRLTGFYSILRAGSLPPGKYEIGMIAADRTSRQRIVSWSDAKLTID